MVRLISIVTIIGIALMYVSAEELYSDKYDDINIGDILSNEKLREQHRKCYANLGPCVTADMRFYKTILGEAIMTKCRRCTEKQKHNLDAMTDWYTKNAPQQWDEFIETLVNNLINKNHDQ